MEDAYLAKIIEFNKKITKMLFRGSINGWYFKDFHMAVDYKGPTITLFRLENGQCIGGYTKCNWSSKNEWN